MGKVRVLLSRNEIKFVDKILETTGDEQKNAIFLLFLHDPVFMNYALFKRDMPPHQRLEMRLMWFRPFYVGTDGYRAGKSTTATYVQMQQCALISGWQEGILSHTAKGTHYLFRDHIKTQYDTNQIFRALIAKKPTMGAEWRIEYKNVSSITAYPSDLLNNSMRLESLSLHGGTLDEVTSFPKPDVIWNVMLNRVTMPVPKVASLLGITNTVRLLGAAKYSFQQIYKARNGQGGLVQYVIQEMGKWAKDNPDQNPLNYVFMSMNLDEHLPPDEVCWACDGNTEYIGRQADGKDYVRCKSCGYVRVAWRRFFASTLKTMNDASHLMGRKLFNMRWRGRWQDTSDEVYAPIATEAMAHADCKIELQRPKEDKSIYTIGVDIGTGATERHSVSGISVLKFSPPDPHFRYVYAKKLRCSLTDLSGHLHNLADLFSPSVIMIDTGGGGVWLVDKDHLGNPEQKIPTSKGTIKKTVTPLIMMGDTFEENGRRVLQLYTPKNYLFEHSLGSMKSSDQLINFSHELTSGLIDAGYLICPLGYSEEEQSQQYDDVVDAVSEARQGLLTIGIEQDQEGIPLLTGNGFLAYTPKPDLAYSLVYGTTAMYLYNQMKSEDKDDEVAQTISVISDSLDNIGSSRSHTPTPNNTEQSGFAILI